MTNTSTPPTRMLLILASAVLLCFGGVVAWLMVERANLHLKLTGEIAAMDEATTERDRLKTKLKDQAKQLRQTERALATTKSARNIAEARTKQLRETTAKYAAKLPMKYKDANLVFVSFDALQAAHVGFLGYPRNATPTIDSIAEQSFAFRYAYSVASWTVPSTTTWFTGAYPSEHKMVNKYAVYNMSEQRLAKLQEVVEMTTLAEIMKQNGYATGGFTGNAGVSGGFGYEAGFDKYYYPKGVFGGLDRSVPLALDWLKENKDKKFFLFLHGYDVHGQRAPVGGFDYRFVEKDYDKRYSGSPREQEVLREQGLANGFITLRDGDVRFWRAIYDEKIQRADAHFRHFLKKFAEMGLTDKTLFVLTSDHGTEFYEHRRFDHGFTLYDELIHVPLFIKLPGQIPGRLSEDRVSSIDIMPTILDLLDIEVSDKIKQQLSGRSLVPTMQGRHTPRDVFSETDYREYTFKRSIIAPDGWKLIYTLENEKRELYHLPTDPGEITNRADREKKRADALQSRLFQHLKSTGHDLSKRWVPGLNPVYPSQAK